MTLNIENTRKYLQDFDFKTLFIEELGWNNPKSKSAFPFQTKEGEFFRKAIAELSGATVYEITNAEGSIPDGKTRDIISKEIQKINFEHILIFIDKNRTQTIWRWLKKQDKKNLPREHYFSSGQTGDLFIAKLSGLMVDISEIENDITITDVARKIQGALDIERVTKQFYSNYQGQFIEFVKLIEGIDNEADKKWYASVILNRLMFIYFLQKKGFIDTNNQDYLYSKLKEIKKSSGKNQYYNSFLKILFFDGFAKGEHLRSASTNKLLGKIKYLNGGLFLKHKIEEKYPNINIPDFAFENLLKSEEPKGLFERFSWSLDDTPGGHDNEINPDVLGYIFEKYINQKAFGAYYTRTEITEYLCEQTVYKLILDGVNEEEVSPDLLNKTGLLKPLHNNKGKDPIILAKANNYTNIAELLISLDVATCRKLVYGEKAILPNLSLLDPACGSGAFLVAAMKTLINVYSAVLGKIDFLGDKKLVEWKEKIKQEHPSINYYIKKQIITNNLYGVDIMEEATEIAKLRLFLALVASAQTVDQLEPLPNIDFNIMCGNSLIGLLRVDANQFNKHFQSTSTRSAKGTVVQKASLFNAATAQANLFGGEHAKNYQQLINDKEAAVASYKNAHELGITDLQELRDSIQKQEAEANKILSELLLEEFSTLGIKYEQVTWDDTKNKEGKCIKRNLSPADVKALQPFHWGYEFSEIFRKKNGFDAIITNPPWEIFKPQSKEFFMTHSDVVTKKKMTVDDFEKEQAVLLKDKDLRDAWLSFLSSYPHITTYFRASSQYKNQVSVIDGKKDGSDINLYKIFLEQSKNLLRDKGYCGIVIPSGIYTDLGTKQLREMLFDENKITGIFCFENRKEIFENVHRSFKFVVLSFEKGKMTTRFPAAFMRHDVEELGNFPEYGSVMIGVELIKRLSPESFSIIEFKNDQEVMIAEKISAQPLLHGNNAGWDLELYGEEFHMNRNASLFRSKPTAYPLYEGKNIWHFDSHFSENRYWINENEIRRDFLEKKLKRIPSLDKIPKDLCNDYETYRLAIRKISSNTNERTLVTSILPINALTGNSLATHFPFKHDWKNYTELRYSYSDLLQLTTILNSYVADYILRARVTTNLNTFYLYQLPVPRVSPKDKWYKPIINRAAKLICTTDQFADLWEEVMKTKWSENVAATTEFERNKLRAELDGIIAHTYELTEEEFTYILGTFPIVAQPQKVAAHNAYRDVVNGTLK